MILVSDPSTIMIPDILSMLGDYSIYNISSMKILPGIQTLNIAPPRELLYQSSMATQSGAIFELDQYYANLLMTDDQMFYQLMTAMRDLYIGKNVILLVYREESVFDGSTESLCKFIQQRYGYNYQMINCPDDINFNDQSSFTVGGIQNFDLDNKRFLNILTRVNPNIFTNEDIAKENGHVI